MGRSTGLVKHTIPDTAETEMNQLVQDLPYLLIRYGYQNIQKIILQKGQDVVVEYLEYVWSSRL